MTGPTWVLIGAGVAVLLALTVYAPFHVRWQRDQRRKRAERELVRAEWDARLEEFRRAYGRGFVPVDDEQLTRDMTGQDEG
jgi:hypothetical protein